MKKLVLVIISFALLTACNDKSIIEGNIKYASGETVYIEHTKLTSSSILDSVKLNDNGFFKFKVNRPQYPNFYKIRLNKQYIVVALDSITEKVIIKASAKDLNHPIIYGSDDSNDILKLRQSSLNLQRSAQKNDINLTADLLENHKNLAHEIVLKNTRSAAAYYAINQMIHEHYYMSPYVKEDLPYWSAVATAYDLYYPEYDRTKELKQTTLIAISAERASKLTANQLMNGIKEEGFIEISLPNRVGELIKLSSMKGKVVLIDFSAYGMEQASAHTLFLRELYNEFNNKGFDIYQISFDIDKLLWLEQSRNTPWICVRDENSTNSQYLRTYNVSQIPTFFLMNKDCEIVGRYNHENIRDAVISLLK